MGGRGSGMREEHAVVLAGVERLSLLDATALAPACIVAVTDGRLLLLQETN